MPKNSVTLSAMPAAAESLYFNPTCEAAIDDLGKTPSSPHDKLVEKQDRRSARPAGNEGGLNGPPDRLAVPRLTDGGLASPVERHKAHDEDESAQGHQGQGVRRDRHHLPVLEATSPWTKDECTLGRKEIAKCEILSKSI